MSGAANDPATGPRAIDPLALVAGLVEVDVSSLDRCGALAALTSLGQLSAWVDLTHARVTRRLQAIAASSPSVVPEADVATAARSSRRDASRSTKRATTIGAVPEVEHSLATGTVSAAHVDALGRALERLQPEQREQLASDGRRLMAIAAQSTPEAFERTLRREIIRLDSSEGEDRLTRQRRSNRLRSWTDSDTGMVCLRGEFDPETGLHLLARIDAVVETLFHTTAPDDCPTGAARADFLRALALARLVDGRHGRGDGAAAAPAGFADMTDGASAEAAAAFCWCGDDGCDGTDRDTDITGPDRRSELIVVIDLETLIHGLHDRSVIDSGYDIDLPAESYRRLACRAAIIPIVLDSDGVSVDQGRAVRLANRRQRRALRAMYRTCAMPGCSVGSRHCEPHHIRWWRHWGRTDLNNLVPLCSKHHHAVHEGGWQLVMHPNRSLTITMPDGAVRTTGPPVRNRTAA